MLGYQEDCFLLQKKNRNHRPFRHCRSARYLIPGMQSTVRGVLYVPEESPLHIH